MKSSRSDVKGTRCILLIVAVFLVIVPVSLWPSASLQEISRLGVTVQQASDGVAVRSVAADGVAARLGVAPGDRLVGINRRQAGTIRELEGLLSRFGTERLTLQLLREGLVTEAFLPPSPEEGRALSGARVVGRRCTILCLDRERRVWRECGCQIAPRKVCNGCIQ